MNAGSRLPLSGPIRGQVSRHSAAPPDVLWALLTDVTQMGRWSPECVAGDWLTPGSALLPGAMFKGHNRFGPLRWSTVCTVEVSEPGRSFSFSARHWSGACTRWTYTFEPDRSGTWVTESFETVDSPAAVLLVDRLARRPGCLHRHMTETLSRLCAAGEAQARPN